MLSRLCLGFLGAGTLMPLLPARYCCRFTDKSRGTAEVLIPQFDCVGLLLQVAACSSSSAARRRTLTVAVQAAKREYEVRRAYVQPTKLLPQANGNEKGSFSAP